MRLRLAARKSDLAKLQAYTVGEAIQQKFPHISVEYHFRESLGDKNLTAPLWQAPEKGLFTEDFYQDLVQGQCDLVVHSWKDLPIVEKEKTFVAATLARADQRDLLLFKKSHHEKVKQCQKLKIFSSSPRRSYNLLHFAKDFFPYPVQCTEFIPVRGNIQTRVHKLLENPEVDALIVAKAAFDRLLSATWEEFKPTQEKLRSALQKIDWMILPLSINPTAAAQGALAIEVARERHDLVDILRAINDQDTWKAVNKERTLLAKHGGGCHQAIGVNVLKKTFGDIQIIRGKTDSNEVLNGFELLPTNSRPEWLKQKKSHMANDFLVVHRKPHGMDLVALQHQQALLVAKADAWPQSFCYSGVVLTAGISTWKKLAQQGQWVHGTLDGMGEEDGLTDLFGLADLCPEFESQKMLKLTHSSANEAPEVMATHHPRPVIAYDIEYAFNTQRENEFHQCEVFFWGSTSSFEFVQAKFPSVRNKIHCCGPGSTAQGIAQVLLKNGISISDHLFIFLNQQEWTEACRQINPLN